MHVTRSRPKLQLDGFFSLGGITYELTKERTDTCHAPILPIQGLCRPKNVHSNDLECR